MQVSSGVPHQPSLTSSSLIYNVAPQPEFVMPLPDSQRTTADPLHKTRDAEAIAAGIHVLGDVIPSDGRASWTAMRPGQFQPVNAYLMQVGELGLLVDTGVAAHEAQVMAQLRTLREPRTALSVFLTRAELECCSNLGAISEEYVIDEVLTGGVINPFDAFDGVAAQQYHDRRVQFDRDPETGVTRLQNITIFPERTLEVHPAKLRLLPTFWLFDPVSRTLFTSDSFAHCTMRAEADSRLLRDSDHDDTTVETVASQLLTKFEWLRGARTGTLRADLISVFERLQPEVVAPTHGCVLLGRSVIERHLAMLLAVLKDCEGGTFR